MKVALIDHSYYSLLQYDNGAGFSPVWSAALSLGPGDERSKGAPYTNYVPILTIDFCNYMLQYHCIRNRYDGRTKMPCKGSCF
jgi:hypothetical protein